jgi:hypothetical protein
VERIKEQKAGYTAELQKFFDRWDYLKIHGGGDPFWSDGSNMNLARKHILVVKRSIEATMKPELYPEIYYRETPPEVDRDYMARTDEIRANARKALEEYKSDPDYQYLCRRITRLTERQKKDTCIVNVIGYVVGLEDAISKDDLITMRRHERASRYIDSFSSCVARIRDIKPSENEQISLFADYSDDEDEWEEEY